MDDGTEDWTNGMRRRLKLCQALTWVSTFGSACSLSGWPSIGPSWEGGPRAYFVYLYIVVDHGTNDLYRCFLGSCDTGVKGEEEKKRGGGN